MFVNLFASLLSLVALVSGTNAQHTTIRGLKFYDYSNADRNGVGTSLVSGSDDIDGDLQGSCLQYTLDNTRVLAMSNYQHYGSAEQVIYADEQYTNNICRLQLYFDAVSNGDLILHFKTDTYNFDTFNLKCYIMFNWLGAIQGGGYQVLHSEEYYLDFTTLRNDVDLEYEPVANYTAPYLLNGALGFGYTITFIPVAQNDSYTDGYNNGYTEGFDDGVNSGLGQGYQNGYTDGYNESLNQDSTAALIFTGILEVGLLPINVFLAIFNFEVFGINISGLVASLLTVAVIVIIIRVILSKSGGGNKE